MIRLAGAGRPQALLLLQSLVLSLEPFDLPLLLGLSLGMAGSLGLGALMLTLVGAGLLDHDLLGEILLEDDLRREHLGHVGVALRHHRGGQVPGRLHG